MLYRIERKVPLTKFISVRTTEKLVYKSLERLRREAAITVLGETGNKVQGLFKA